jgi:DNA-binding protein HU-beta
MAAKFVVKKGTTGKWRFNLLSTNGKTIATSEAYETKRAMLAGIEAVRKNAANATVVDPSADGGTATTARKATARKTTARKATARKATARKTTARKTTARKTTARKTTARKTTGARTSPARRTTARKTTARSSTTTR